MHFLPIKLHQGIVHFAYNNDPKITSKNLFPLITACDKYDISSLIDSCHKLLCSHLNAANFCAYFHDAAQQKPFDKTVLGILKDFFERNYAQCLSADNFCSFFNELVVRNSFHLDLSAFIAQCGVYVDEANRVLTERILNSDGFLTMNLKAMRLFLERSIQCKEETIWESVVKWAKYQDSVYQEVTVKIMKADSDAEEDEDLDAKYDEKESEIQTKDRGMVQKVDHRLFLLQSVRDLIRFGLMDGPYFTENVVESQVLTAEELVSVLAYYQVPERGCGTFNTESRTGRARYKRR